MTYRDDPDNCFCVEHNCMKEAWECHTSADCAKLDKCKELEEGRGCSCVDSTCESQCATKVRRRRVRVMPSYSAGKLVFKRALDIVNFFFILLYSKGRLREGRAWV